MLVLVLFCGSILLELLPASRELLLGRETDRLDIEDRDDCEPLFEPPGELCLPPELLEEDREDDDLRLCLDAKTGSDKITAPSIIISTNLRLNTASFMIEPRTNSLFDIMRQVASDMAIIILAKRLRFVKQNDINITL